MFESSSPFHEGELSVQHRAGTRGVAEELSTGISTLLSVVGVDSLFSGLRLVWVASLSPPRKPLNSHSSSVWVSPVFGKPGFVQTRGCTSVVVDLPGGVPPEDILLSNLQQKGPQPVGFLAQDMERRRRYRINGYMTYIANSHAQSEILVREAFPNCPKYIQKRFLDANTENSNPVRLLSNDTPSESLFEEGRSLSKADINLIASSDSFFLGTYYDNTRLDVNHRGGQPGFVRVKSENELYWPDYRGNGMFQSLGNIHGSGQAGITFLNYGTGELLQLTGRAEIVWDARETLHMEAAAERAVRFFVERVRRSVGPVTNYRWENVEYSPYNPVVMEGKLDGGTTASKTGQYPMDVKLVKIVRESRNVKTFRFLAPERIKFLPGQYATFEFSRKAGMAGSEKVINRTWTLSESPNSVEGDVTLEISVKRKEGGLMSTWLHDHAQEGLSVKLLGIGGEMTPFSERNGSSKMLLISGGIGITPNMSILRGIGAFERVADVVFIHQEREIEDMPFQKELKRRAENSGGRTRMVRLVSGRGGIGEKEEEEGVISGRVTKEVLLSMTTDLSDRDIYLCGPRGFMKSVTGTLLEAGAQRHRITTEDFSF